MASNIRNFTVPHNIQSRGRAGLEVVDSVAQWHYQHTFHLAELPSLVYWLLSSDFSPFIVSRSLPQVQTSQSQATTQHRKVSLPLCLHSNRKKFSQKALSRLLPSFWSEFHLVSIPKATTSWLIIIMAGLIWSRPTPPGASFRPEALGNPISEQNQNPISKKEATELLGGE